MTELNKQAGTVFTMADTFSSGYISSSILPQFAMTHDVDILLAVESGSRMWGFESKDSDHDIRLITRQNDRFGYISGEGASHGEETIGGGQFDLAWWDVKKFLSLMGKGNGTCVEWLSSPIVYAKNEEAYTLLHMLQLRLINEPFIRRRLCYHYHNLAYHSFHEGDGKDENTFPLKKLLYAVRAYAMYLYYMNTRDPILTLPSPRLMDLVKLHGDTVLTTAVENMIAMKLEGDEKSVVVDRDNDDYLLCRDFVSGASKRLTLGGDEEHPNFMTECNTILRAVLNVPNVHGGYYIRW